jgi:hypothetical protein
MCRIDSAVTASRSFWAWLSDYLAGVDLRPQTPQLPQVSNYKYMAVAAVVCFLLALLLTHGSLFAGFGALALVAGIGWVARHIMS